MKRGRIRGVAVVLAAVLLVAPAWSMAASPRQAGGAGGWWSWVESLFGPWGVASINAPGPRSAVAQGEDNGPNMDPDGLAGGSATAAGPPPAPQAESSGGEDNGPDMDPNG